MPPRPSAEQERERQEAVAPAAPPTARTATVHRARVEWTDTDASGHYHNSLVMRLVEAAEAKLMRERGVTDYFGVSPRVRQEINFEARLWFDQPVTCEVVLEDVGRTSMTFSFEVRAEPIDEHPGQRAASGRFVVVHAPDPRGGAQPWPPAWLEALGR